MALTITTDLVRLTDAETYASPPWFNIGAQAAATEPDFFVQGSNSISRAVSGAVSKGMVFDNTTAIDFTTGTHKDKLVYIWMRSSTPGLCSTRAAAGVTVRLATSGAATNYRDWYVDGSDTLVSIEGWTCYVIDPQSAGSATSGSYSAASVRYFGGYMTTTTTAKGQNFGIDAIYYGRGEIRVTGTVTNAGQGFKEIAAADFGDSTNGRWGIVTEKQGIYYIKGKIVIGHASTATTFTSQNETIIFETPSYKSATDVVKSIPDASVGGTTGSDGNTTYNGLAFIGGSAATTVDLGVIVGTDNGRSGTSFTCVSNNGLTTPGRTKALVSASDSSMALNIYNCTFSGFEGGIDLYGTNLTGDDCFGNTFSGCGRIRSNMQLRNNKILNSVAAADDGAYLWESTTDFQTGLFVNNSRAIVFESTTGTPFSFTGNTFSSNTFDIRNESLGAITINVTGGTTPTYENIGGGSATTVNNAVNVTITVVDKNNTPIQSAQVAVYKTSDDTQIMNEATDASGIATESYNLTGDTAIYARIRKSTTGSTRYIPVNTSGTITSSGFTATVTLTQDTTASA